MLKYIRILVPGTYLIGAVILIPHLSNTELSSDPTPLTTGLAWILVILGLLVSLFIGWKSLSELRFRRLFLGSNTLITLGIIGLLIFRNGGLMAIGGFILSIILVLLGGALASTAAFLKRSK